MISPKKLPENTPEKPPEMSCVTLFDPQLRLDDSNTPFVLLDDARQSKAAPARLFRNPVAMLTAQNSKQIPALLDDLAKSQSEGLYAAGYLSFDAGVAFPNAWRGKPKPKSTRVDKPIDKLVNSAALLAASPLAWFGLFKQAERITPDKVPHLLPDPASAWIGKVKPQISQTDYEKMAGQILQLIRNGDIYQANLTFAADLTILGGPLAAYARMRSVARAGYGGLIWTGEQVIASHSPELFFTLRGDEITARPMKGTARRSTNRKHDAELRRKIACDPKQRAENLMIVDLLRNDLSRVARAGSVKVPALFRVETYPTIHQLVSDVTIRLRPGLGAIDVLRATFPCGSITGAPKARSMEILAEIENTPRGIYTGSIGFIEPSGDSAFNIAIRTLVFPHNPRSKSLPHEPSRATLGLGAAIVADSRLDWEWDECLAKGVFVKAAENHFDLIETMFFDPVEGVYRINAHMARMKASAEEFGFRFDHHSARNMLQSVTLRLKKMARVRIRLARSGALAVETSDIPRLPEAPLAVVSVPLPVRYDDFRLAHKTSLRDFYDQARKKSGAFEILFIDPQGFATEGSFTNVFVKRDDKLLTPPAHLGLLRGVLRQELLEKGLAIESLLRLSDFADGFFIGNSLRGLIPARLVVSAAERLAGSFFARR